MKTYPKSFRTFYLFLLIVFIWCLFYGGSKFFLKNITKEFFDIDPKILLEDIAGYMSIGGIIAYALGGSIANMLTKRMIYTGITIFASLIVMTELLFGLSHYIFLIITALSIGFSYATFAVLRNIVTFIEILKTKLPDTMVNGIATIIFIFGVIGGAFVSTLGYEKLGNNIVWVFLGILFLALPLSYFLKYEPFEHHQGFKESFKSFLVDSKWILKEKAVVILASSSLWVIATIVSLKSIPISVEKFGIPESSASLVLLYSAIGVILGNVATMKIQNRWRYFRIAAYGFSILVFAFHLLAVSFTAMIVYSIAVGFCMGAATNLIDAYYLVFVGKAHKKENGAGIYGVVLNLMLSSLFFVLQLFPNNLVFYIMGIIPAFFTILIRLNLKVLRE